MSDNNRLSSTQALEDYFVDLLLEPEPELESESELAAEVEAGAELTSGEEQESSDSAQEPSAEELVSTEEIAGTEEAAVDCPRPDNDIPQDAGLLTKQATAAVPAAKPFDFASLEERSESRMPSPVLDNVQRLLNQVNKVSLPEPSVSEPSTVDADLADDWQQVMAHEQAKELASVQVQDPQPAPLQQPVVLVAEPEPIESPGLEGSQAVEDQAKLDAQPEAQPETKPETQAEGLPPDNWSQQGYLGNEFQALFFEVNGVTFAVPLTELGGIHQLGEVNRLLGRPPWYLGLMSGREHQLDVVDTACWVMPDKLDGEEYREQYKYLVMLGESSWGLACNALLGTQTLSEHSVRWREKAGKRPWLAGMVKEKMCALIHVSELITMLKSGLDVNTKLRQS